MCKKMRNWVWKEPNLQKPPIVVSQSGRIESDFRALSERIATLYRRLVANWNYLAMDRRIDGESRFKPERCGYGQSQECGATSAWTTDHLDALPLGGAIRPHHGENAGVWGAEECLSTMADPEVVVKKKAEGGVAVVVGE